MGLLGKSTTLYSKKFKVRMALEELKEGDSLVPISSFGVIASLPLTAIRQVPAGAGARAP